MIYKTQSSLSGHVRVVFELPSSVWAHRVSVIGEFNNWQGQGEPLYQERDGYWRAVVDLPTNCQYKFHYLVDGQAVIDRYADGLSQGEYQEQKSIVSTRLPLNSSSPVHRNVHHAICLTSSSGQPNDASRAEVAEPHG